jgi:hypothetical protein
MWSLRVRCRRWRWRWNDGLDLGVWVGEGLLDVAQEEAGAGVN